MAVMLPFFLGMPILLVIIFEVQLCDWLRDRLRSLIEPDETGSVTRTGRIVNLFSRRATVSVERVIGGRDHGQARKTGHEERTDVLASAQDLRRPSIGKQAKKTSESWGANIVRASCTAQSSPEARRGDGAASTMQVQVEIEPDEPPAALKMQAGLQQALAEGTSPEELSALLVAAAGERADRLVAACSESVADRSANVGVANTTGGADDVVALEI